MESVYNSTIFYLDTDSHLYPENCLYSKDPVSMKYKSTKHIVFKFNKYSDRRVLLPAVDGSMYPHTIDKNAYYDVL
jgi:hypothetical protein